MLASFYLRGLLIGLSIAAAVGPISMLCIQRSLERGFASGLVTGLGAATADAFYGSVAAFGLTVISTSLIHEQFWIRLIGGLFLVYLGIKTLLIGPARRAAQASRRGLPGTYISTMLLTLTNPLTIISFAAVFAGIGVGIVGESKGAAAVVVAGVFCGSGIWWLLLSGGVSLLKNKLRAGWLLLVHRCAGGALLIFGLIAIFSLVLS